MNTIFNFILLSAITFGLVSLIYLQLKTIKLI